MLCMKIGKNRNHSGKASSQHHLTERTFPFHRIISDMCATQGWLVRKCIKGSLRWSYWSHLVLLPRDPLVLLGGRQPCAGKDLWLFHSCPQVSQGSLVPAFSCLISLSVVHEPLLNCLLPTSLNCMLLSISCPVSMILLRAVPGF